jgi:hypothetical protein
VCLCFLTDLRRRCPGLLPVALTTTGVDGIKQTCLDCPVEAVCLPSNSHDCFPFRERISSRSADITRISPARIFNGTVAPAVQFSLSDCAGRVSLTV